jgi:transposase-like protein
MLASLFRADARGLREAEEAAPSQAIRHPSYRFRTACPRAYTVVIARKAGVSTNTLRYWMTLSREGYVGDPFDIKLEDGRTERFHILFEDAIREGFDKVERRPPALAAVDQVKKKSTAARPKARAGFAAALAREEAHKEQLTRHIDPSFAKISSGAGFVQ